jgi:glycerophosphoryl diester phosphodiesterase
MKNIICIAHRGAMAYAPQNTMKSFALACEMRADMIELDVHLTSDGAAVVNHDPVFRHTDPPAGKIREMTLEQVRVLRFQGEPIPALEEVIEYIKPRGVGLNIECKVVEAAPEVVRLVRRHAFEKMTLVSSFIPRALAEVKKCDPAIGTGYLTPPVLSPFGLPRARLLGCESINPNKAQVNRAFVAAARKLGLKIFPWTVNDEKTMRRFITLGVDGIITNKPDLLNKLKDT